MPEELEGTESPSINTVEEDNALKAKYGFSHWRSWRQINWGTKWNAVNASNWTVEDEDYYLYSTSIKFLTAWRCPFPFIKRLSHLYPLITFYVFYTNEGNDEKVYVSSVVDGKIVSERTYNTDEEVGKEILEYMDQ